MTTQEERHQALRELIAGERQSWPLERQEEVGDEEALAKLIARYFRWDGMSILETAHQALTEANFHAEATVVDELLLALTKRD